MAKRVSAKQPGLTRAVLTTVLGYVLLASSAALALAWLESHTVRMTFFMPLTNLPGGWQTFLDKGNAYFIGPKPPYGGLHIPLWPFILGLLAAGAWFSGSRRRRSRAGCRGCQGCARCVWVSGARRRVAGATLVVTGIVFTAVWAWSGWWIGTVSAGGSIYWLGAGTLIGRTDGHASVHAVHATATATENTDGWSWRIVDKSSSTPPAPFPGLRLPPLVFPPAAPITGFPLPQQGANEYNLYFLSYQHGTNGYRRGAIALWPFAAVLFISGGWLYWAGRRARRRANRGMCVHCGYSFAGLAIDAPCPECGRSRPRST
jgi:hypothetical protein